MKPPSAATLSAFNLSPPSTELLSPLEGGRGNCYVHRPSENPSTWTVLRPADDPAEVQFLAELLTKLLDPPSSNYRLVRPVPISPPLDSDPSATANYIGPGNWTAQSYLAGSAGPKGRWNELFAASRALQTDLARTCKHKPSFMDDPTRTNRWREADLLTWNEKSLSDVANVNQEMLSHLQPFFDRLERLQTQLVFPDNYNWESKFQLIHGDLTGNILFFESKEMEKLPPAIIDFTPYWRPAMYADAVVLADALAWHGEGIEVVHLYCRNFVDGDDARDLLLHLLVKALYWRCITIAIDTDNEWVRMHWSKTDYQGAVEVVEEAVRELKR